MYVRKNSFAFSLQLPPTDHGILVCFQSGYTVLHILYSVSDYSMKRPKYFQLAILNRLVVPADESHHILKIRDETGLLPVQVVINYYCHSGLAIVISEQILTVES